MKIDETFLSGEYFNNDSEKLIIITTGNPVSSVVSPTIKKLYECNDVSEKEILTKELKEILSKYNYFKYSQNKDCDYLYLLDFYDGFFGYFFSDGEKYILNDVVSQLDNFIIENGYKKENVTIFGSSKGGYAAMLLGNECQQIGNVIGVIPALDLTMYENRHQDPNYFIRKISDTLFGSEKRQQNTMRIMEKIKNYGNGEVDESKKQLYILGLRDLTFFKPAFEILNNENNFDLLLVEHIYGHGAVSALEQNNIKKLVYNYPNLNVAELPYTYMKNTKTIQKGRHFLEFELTNNGKDKLVIFTEHLDNRKFIDNFVSKSKEYNYLVINDRANNLCGFNFIEEDSDILIYLARELDSLIIREKIKRDNVVIVGIGAAAVNARLLMKNTRYINNNVNINPELNIRKYTANKENYSKLRDILYGNETREKITKKYNRKLNNFSDQELFVFKSITTDHKINKKQVDVNKIYEYGGLVDNRMELVSESIKLAFNVENKLKNYKKEK